ncbi:isoprenoid biosynthesis glyoxalase ElbB [Permianibacter fluminis]|uniref:isoprenoid biosynthesis glyoxalase ElbB n=1 Tax=Permianibacter fluminis TaxID=2738515 RepID=UPI001B7D7D1E|nr:isoprenoid biosynthesis glyoxalase ElbB [Permianibacter fluminis]
MKVAIVLSGCGVYDGAEIHESVLTMLALARAGVAYQCLAPNIAQAHVVNHLSGQPSAGETRNVLVEAARIARGDIVDIAKANPSDYAALFFPGGFGAAKNLCDFAFKGADCSVQPDVLKFARAFAEAGKPVCFVCIAPAMIPRIYGDGARGTIGTDADTAAAIEQMGGVHVSCPVREFVVDEQRKIVSTPAYMLAQNIGEAADGIEKAVKATLALIK